MYTRLTAVILLAVLAALPPADARAQAPNPPYLAQMPSAARFGGATAQPLQSPAAAGAREGGEGAGARGGPSPHAGHSLVYCLRSVLNSGPLL